MTNFIPGARPPAHVFDEENIVDCPDCHRPTEVDEGRRVHVNTGEIECGPKVYGYVKHNEYRILEIICNACVTPRERAAIRSNAYGILPVERPGTIVCRRCLEKVYKLTKERDALAERVVIALDGTVICLYCGRGQRDASYPQGTCDVCGPYVTDDPHVVGEW